MNKMNGPQQMPALGVIINGSGISCPPTVDLEDFEPVPRDRCNTWPLQKPAGDLAHHTSPLIHEEIPEEDSLDDGSGDNLSDSIQSGIHMQHRMNGSNLEDHGNFLPGANGGANSKKNSARRNAWGNLSYADLITQAILNSNEKRLTLSQIYDWMVQNVPYFRDKGDSNSSAGWKNSIRHNLSLHSRFMRIQNEGAGKSSWWVINPEAKPGKSSRRRAGSMEQSKNLEKKRGRVKKKLDQMRGGSTGALDVAGLLSPNGHDSSDMFDSSPAATAGGASLGFVGLSPGEFRPRSDSNLSNYSVGSHHRMSPQLDDFEDWGAPASVQQGVGGQTGVDVSYPELVDSLSHSMNLSGGNLESTAGHYLSRDILRPPPYSNGPNNFLSESPAPGQIRRQASPQDLCLGGRESTASYHQTTPTLSPRRTTPIKSSPQHQFAPSPIKTEPPSYQELYPGGRTGSNPMLRDVLQKANVYQQTAAMQSNRLINGVGGAGTGNLVYYNHQGHNGGIHALGFHSNGATNGHGQLPLELSDIRYDNHFTSDIQCDIDQVIRHELNVAGKLDFTSDFGNI